MALGKYQCQGPTEEICTEGAGPQLLHGGTVPGVRDRTEVGVHQLPDPPFAEVQVAEEERLLHGFSSTFQSLFRRAP